MKATTPAGAIPVRGSESDRAIVTAGLAPPCPDRRTVRNGIVQLWGPVADERVAQALRVAAENVPGVKSVEVTTLP